ncbi:hypothetical protein PVAND_001291 [Polypedilum vanderplanki]|uniref:GYF domain-containing protein n=1 Tax=Polypedilum vanderplanki TaxID=319348 RepID=A0A9J6BMY4_POLVA|nr:hypothetical protein PVAND_001291 [Polypedilum vanderplanki]
MSESLKFGPKWLRNTIATSPTKQDETISRPILSECRFSREEMLSFCESSDFKPEPYVTYPKMFSSQWQTPLAFQTEEREKEKTNTNETTHGGRLFLNSNMKHGNQAWRKAFVNEDKASSENWRAQKDSGGTGVYYNNTYNDQQRKTSWRNPENTTENLQMEQQKSPPVKPTEATIINNNNNKSPFISPMNKEFIEYHQQSQDNLKNYLMENPNFMLPQTSTIEMKKDLGAIGMNVARQLFESDQINTIKPSTSTICPKAANKENAEKVDMYKFESDLVKNLTDLVYSSESDFNKLANSNKSPTQSALPSLPPISVHLQANINNNNGVNAACTSNSVERPPIYWFYIDPHGKEQGPFSEEEMSHWYQTNYFQDMLMVRRSIDNNFIALRSLIKIYGSAHPFTVASNYFPIPRMENYFEQFHPSQGAQLQQFSSNVANNGLDAFNQYQILSNLQYKQQQQQPPAQQIPMNFLAQPFPTINKAPLPGSNRIANNAIKVNQFAQLPSQPVLPSNNYSMCAQNNFQIPPKPMLPNSFKFMNNPNTIQPPPSSISFSQQQRTFENNNGIGMESIQKALFDIQRQHELHVQQSMTFLQYQQQEKIAQPSTSYNAQNSMNPQTTNKISTPSSSSSPTKLLPPYMIDTYEYNTNDEDDFQKVDYHRKKRNQKEKENASKVIEKNKSFISINNSDTMKTKEAPNSVIDTNNNPLKKNAEIIEEKCSTTTPAPWFRNVTLSQNDDNTINNIEFTFANHQFQPIEPWPKISPEKDMAMKNPKKLSTNDDESKTQKSLSAAPWLKINQSDDGKSLKKIQIEEEEANRKLQLKNEREKHVQECNQNKQNELSKTVWKPIIVGCVDKEKEIEGEGWHLPLTKKNDNNNQGAVPKKKECEQTSEERELHNWCVETLMKLNPNIDIPAFTIFLRSIESPFELEDYVKAYFGDTGESKKFLDKYLKYRSTIVTNKTKHQELDDDLCVPAKAINPTSSSASSINGDIVRKAPQNKRNKESNRKSKKSMKVVDSNILGFKGAANSDRIVGEIDKLNYYVKYDYEN